MTLYGWIMAASAAGALWFGLKPLPRSAGWATGVLLVGACIAFVVTRGRMPSLPSAGIWFLLLVAPSAVSDYLTARVSLAGVACATVSAAAWYGEAAWIPLLIALSLALLFAVIVILLGQAKNLGAGDVALVAALIAIAPAMSSLLAVMVGFAVQLLCQRRLGEGRSAIYPAVAVGGLVGLLLSPALWWYGMYPTGVLV